MPKGSRGPHRGSGHVWRIVHNKKKVLFLSPYNLPPLGTPLKRFAGAGGPALTVWRYEFQKFGRKYQLSSFLPSLSRFEEGPEVTLLKVIALNN